MTGVKQISVFLANKAGRIADVTKILGDNDIDIIALSIADSANYGALRMITDDYTKTMKVLKENHFTVAVTEVLAVEIANVPGALSVALNALADAEIEVEYIYAFVGKQGDHARVIIRIDDNAAAAKVLEAVNMKILKESDVYAV